MIVCDRCREETSLNRVQVTRIHRFIGGRYPVPDHHIQLLEHRLCTKCTTELEAMLKAWVTLIDQEAVCDG